MRITPEALRGRRLKLGFSIRDLAAKARVSPSYISNLENGSRNGYPSFAIVRRLADALEVEPDDLFSGVCPACGQDLETADS